MTTMELMTLAKNRIADVYSIAEKKYNRKFNLPTIDFKIRGRVAGRAFYLKNHISLNLSLLIQEGNDFISDTPGHEAAHLIAFALYGSYIAPHGTEWRNVMRSIGQEANRCHDFLVKTNNVYVCNCQNEHYLSTRRHNQILLGKVRVTCNTCRQVLVPKKWHNTEEVRTNISDEKKERLFAGFRISA